MVTATVPDNTSGKDRTVTNLSCEQHLSLCSGWDVMTKSRAPQGSQVGLPSACRVLQGGPKGRRGCPPACPPQQGHSSGGCARAPAAPDPLQERRRQHVPRGQPPVSASDRNNISMRRPASLLPAGLLSEEPIIPSENCRCWHRLLA